MLPMTVEKAHYFQIAARLYDRKEAILVYAPACPNSLLEASKHLSVVLRAKSFQASKFLSMLKELFLVRNIEMSPRVLIQQKSFIIEEQMPFVKLPLWLVKIINPSCHKNVLFILGFIIPFHQILVT